MRRNSGELDLLMGGRRSPPANNIIINNNNNNNRPLVQEETKEIIPISPMQHNIHQTPHLGNLGPMPQHSYPNPPFILPNIPDNIPNSNSPPISPTSPTVLVLKAVEGQLINNIFIVGENGAALGRHSASNDIGIYCK